jgi:hypothetical protein
MRLLTKPFTRSFTLENVPPKALGFEAAFDLSSFAFFALFLDRYSPAPAGRRLLRPSPFFSYLCAFASLREIFRAPPLTGTGSPRCGTGDD